MLVYAYSTVANTLVVAATTLVIRSRWSHMHSPWQQITPRSLRESRRSE